MADQPWAFAIETNDGDWLDGEDCIFGDLRSAEDRVFDLNEECEEAGRYIVVPLYRTPTAAQLSQAVEAATAPLHRIIQMQNAERIAINEENQRNYNDLVARQETIVEAAQGAMLGAAARSVCGYCAEAHPLSNLDPVPVKGKDGAFFHNMKMDGLAGVRCLATPIRALQTESMAAALAARDKRIRAEGKLAEAEWWNQNHGSQHDGNWKIRAGRRLTELRAAARKETP